MDKFLILRDTREKTGFWDWGETDECLGCAIETIKYGDYSIKGLEHLIFMERKKTTAEFATNCTEKRFKKLLENAIGYKYKFCIMEFDFNDVLSYPKNSGLPPQYFKKVKIHPNFLVGCLTSMSVTYGINVIYAGGMSNAEKICYSIFKQIYRAECILNKN